MKTDEYRRHKELVDAADDFLNWYLDQLPEPARRVAAQSQLVKRLHEAIAGGVGGPSRTSKP